MTRFNGRSDFNMPLGGSYEPKEEICDLCDGKGWSVQPDEEGNPERQDCKWCFATGIVTKED